MGAVVDVDVRGLPEVRKMLGQVEGRELNNRTRRALRAGVKPIREELRRRASSGKFPRKFKQTRTRAHRNPLGVSVSPGSPLSNVFEHGAKSHTIAPTHGLVLASDQGAREPFFARGAVRHPGMAARPISGPAFEAKKDEAVKAFSDELLKGI